jgi:hypothetical protein
VGDSGSIALIADHLFGSPLLPPHLLSDLDGSLMPRREALRDATAGPRTIPAGHLRPAANGRAEVALDEERREAPPVTLERQHKRLSEAVKERLRVSIEGEDFPVHLTLDEAEGISRVLWEVVGHMGDDVGEKGYEFNLITRAREVATGLQAAVLASVARSGPHLVPEIENDE